MKSARFRQLSYVSTLIVLANIGIFLIGELTGDGLYNAGALLAYPVLVQGEYWRIVSAMFLHAGVPHLFNNMLVLFFLGDMIERELGHIPFLLVYMISGIGGNILSFLWKCINGSLAGSVGASGAIFGLDGVLLAMVFLLPRYRRLVSPTRVILMIVLSVYNGFGSQRIDNAAHVGGLITGFLVGIIVCLIKRFAGKRRYGLEH